MLRVLSVHSLQVVVTSLVSFDWSDTVVSSALGTLLKACNSLVHHAVGACTPLCHCLGWTCRRAPLLLDVAVFAVSFTSHPTPHPAILLTQTRVPLNPTDAEGVMLALASELDRVNQRQVYCVFMWTACAPPHAPPLSAVCGGLLSLPWA